MIPDGVEENGARIGGLGGLRKLPGSGRICAGGSKKRWLLWRKKIEFYWRRSSPRSFGGSLADSAELADWADFEEFGSARICAGLLRIWRWEVRRIWVKIEELSADLFWRSRRIDPGGLSGGSIRADFRRIDPSGFLSGFQGRLQADRSGRISGGLIRANSWVDW